MVKAWQDALHRCVVQAMEMGHLRSDIDPQQLVYEMYGLILALHHDARFIKRPGSVERARLGFERLLQSYRADGHEDVAKNAKPAKAAVKKLTAANP
jgi:hypothetical protein